ncbi:MAG: RnfABCDGE type electron transport complex subunit D [Defluviitaleaceae bacterium]|nr:RnfABCDGE type electron transport complex subunit D [Defluviitaleaceae bacterium]
MEKPLYTVTSTPHIHSTDTIDKTMRYVLLALVPATIAGVVFFGLRALMIILISIAAAIIFEVLFQKTAKRPVTVSDGSAAVTGLLLGLVLPPAVPLWFPIVGAFVAIIVVKQLFGGLGQNFLNPALAARAVLMAAYALPMTAGFFEPQGLYNWTDIDVVASPTPLAIIGSEGFYPAAADFVAAFVGNISGSIGETSVIALLIGAAFLFYKKVISWHIPICFIASAGVFVFIFNPNMLALYHLITGGLMLGAFFMATDYPTSPMTPMGKVVFGIGCGILTGIIRLFGGFPEGVAYAILLMNLTVPLIDRYVRPRVLGTKRRGA